MLKYTSYDNKTSYVTLFSLKKEGFKLSKDTQKNKIVSRLFTSFDKQRA